MQQLMKFRCGSDDNTSSNVPYNSTTWETLIQYVYKSVGSTVYQLMKKH